jgi:hypothetical protein
VSTAVALATAMGICAMTRPAAAGSTPSQPCAEGRNCATLQVEALSSAVVPGDTVEVRVVFHQAGHDQQPGGVDELAALSLTVGLPGLALVDCSAPGANGLNPSFFVLSSSIGYRVVVQNLTCDGRESCLCPSGTEPADPYINLLLVGDPGAAGVQALPNGELLRVTLRVGPGSARVVPLHVYSALDDGTGFPAPEGGALLSIGDVKAVDRTVDAGDTMNVRITDVELNVVDPTPMATETATAGTTTPSPGTGDCAGDCNHSGEVTINELLTGVGIALGSRPLSSCQVLDCAATGHVEISCLIAAVNAALKGCPHL